MKDLPQKEPGEVTVVSDRNGVYGDRSGVAHEDRVVSNDYGGKEYLTQKKGGPEYEKAVADFKVKVKEAVEKGTLNYEDLFLEGEFVVGDVSKKKHEKALEVSKEIDKDFVDAKSMKPLDFFKKIAEIVQSPNGDKDYRNKNPYVSDAYSDPERIANCKARTAARISKIQKYRPDLMKYVMTQEFGDHVRAVMLYEGKLYSLDGSRQFDLELRPRELVDEDKPVKKSPFELLQDPEEVMGSAFMSFEDYFVKKFLGEEIDGKKVLADSRNILKQAGFNPHLIDEHTNVKDDRDMNYRKNDVFGDDDAIHGLSNYGGAGETDNGNFTGSFNSGKEFLAYFKDPIQKGNKNIVGDIQFKFGEDVPEWPFILESLQSFHYLKRLSFNFEHVADDSMYMVEDENGEHDTLIQGSNPLPSYEKNSAFAEGLASLDGVEELRLGKLKNLSPELWDGVTRMRSLKLLSLKGLDHIPDYFWKTLPELKSVDRLFLNVPDMNKDFTIDNLRKITSMPAISTIGFSFSDVSTVKDWKVMGGMMKKTGMDRHVLYISSVNGVERFDDDFVDFLLLFQAVSPDGTVSADSGFVLEGTYTPKDISVRNFSKIIAMKFTSFKFKPEVYLAYWKELVKVRGKDKAMKILNLAIRDYAENERSAGKIGIMAELLDELGISGEELLSAHKAWLDAKVKKSSAFPPLYPTMPMPLDASKLPKKSSE